MAASTASRTCGLTFGELLMTRDTVARDTPATAATVSRVGASPEGVSSGTVFFPVPPPTLVGGDHRRVPVRAVLERTTPGREVDVDDAEALRVPVRPLEIVQQRPHEVA